MVLSSSRRLRSLAILAGCVFVLTSGAAIWRAGGAAAARAAAAAVDPAERGRYLVNAIGCHDCHTPWVMTPSGAPEPDMTRALSGHPEDMLMTAPTLAGEGWGWSGSFTNTAYSGPWGVSYAANLTPDPSGLGPWTEEIFIQTLRTGRHWGVSRPILPPMPWPGYAQMTDADLKAVFAYLRTLTPIRNHVPEPWPPTWLQEATPGTPAS